MRTSSDFSNSSSFLSDKVSNKNFFSEMVASYSSVKFAKKGKLVAARDYLNVKVWDVCNTSKPLMTIPLQESIKSKLCDLF